MRLLTTLPRLAAAMTLSAACGLASASQTFVFPIGQVEGLNPEARPESRPLIDAQMRRLLIQDEATRADLSRLLDDALLAQLQAAYPDSVVNAAQVATSLGGGSFGYLGEVSCGQGFHAPLRRSFAVVLGLSRASLYVVPRIDGRVEVLAPVTLNLQLIKPDAGKIVYSLSDTQYQTFTFAAGQAAQPQSRQLVVDKLKSSMQAQVAALVAQLKTSFQPRDTVAKVLGEDQKSFVIDKGYEVGLQAGEQIEVTRKGSDKVILVSVLSTDSGYSVIRPVGGALDKGDELVLTEGANADDSRKPRVLPLVSDAQDQRWTSAVAELFGKQIGFKAPFQILPADLHFSDTMDMMNASLRCLDETAKKALKKTAGERTEEPNFYLRFERSNSPRFRATGLGGVETQDTFMTSLSAQLIDDQGDVIFSALGNDTYKQARIGNQGIAIAQAEEISLKNATAMLAQQVVDKARLEPAEFRIAKVDGQRLQVPGLLVPEGETVKFQVMRTLGVKVGSRNAVRRLAVVAGDAAPTAEKGGAMLSFADESAAQDDDRPRAGDQLRVLDLPTAGRARYSECRSPYQAANGSMAADDLLPLVRHATYGSTLYQINVATPGFVQDVNALLQANHFSTTLKAAEATETCVRAAYIVRPEPLKCTNASTCSSQIKISPAALFIKGSARAATYSLTEAVTLDGFSETEANNFMGFKAHEHLVDMLPNLTKSLNTPK